MQKETQDKADADVLALNGFVIHASQPEIRVWRSHEAYSPENKRRRSVIMLASIGVSIFLSLCEVNYLAISDSTSRRHGLIEILTWAISLLWTGLPAVAAFRWLYPNKANLRIDCDCVEVEQEFLWKRRRIYLYPRASIKHFRYVEPFASWIGRPGYLAFSVNGKVVKSLPGIGIAESRNILIAIDRMGYEVESTVE